MPRKTSFYYSFLVLPAKQRRAIIAVWDFCHAIDDAVDEGSPEPLRSAKALSNSAGGGAPARVGYDAVRFWRAELARCYGGAAPQTAEGRRLQPYIAQLDLPREAFEDVIDGIAMDVETTRYETFADLLEYCRRVASAVGIICLRIFGCPNDRGRDYALNLGVALQMTNILRDVKSDLARGRVYLPLEDLAAAGCTIEDLAAESMSDPVRRLIELECGRARSYYGRAVAARPPEHRRRLVAAEIMRVVYFETLRRIERSDYDVFSGRARVPRLRQASLALRQWLWQP